MKNTIKTKPKLEDFIPGLGFKYYNERYEEDKSHCYDLNGQQVAQHIEYIIEMLFYHLITTSSILSGLTYLACSSLQ